MNSISHKQIIKIRTVLVITLLWMIFFSFIVFYEYSSYKLRFPEEFHKLNPLVDMGSVLLASLLAGLTGGSIFVFNLNNKARKGPFYYGIILSILYFLAIYLFIATTMSMLVLSIQRGQSPFDPEVIRITFIENLFAPYQARNFILWLIVVMITQFMLQVNDKFGPGNLWKIFTGRYYRPREE